MKLYEAWKNASGSVFIPHDSPDKEWLVDDSEFLFSIWADSWEEAMKKFHEKMGWEDYKPMKE